jgi:hypothetical protein
MDALYQFTICPASAITVTAEEFNSPKQYSVTFDGFNVGAAGTGLTVTVT